MHLQAAEIERRIELETKAEKHIQKLLLLGALYMCFLYIIVVVYSFHFYNFLKLKFVKFSNFQN